MLVLCLQSTVFVNISVLFKHTKYFVYLCICLGQIILLITLQAKRGLHCRKIYNFKFLYATYKPYLKEFCVFSDV